MAERLEDVLRALGERLAGEGVTERQRSWQLFLAANPEAARLAEHLEARHSEVLELDSVPPEWFPEWDEEARCSLWVEASDLEIMDGWSDLRSRWCEFDPVTCPPDPIEGYSVEEVDNVSFELFFLRLPQPAGIHHGPTIAEYLAEIRESRASLTAER